MRNISGTDANKITETSRTTTYNQKQIQAKNMANRDLQVTLW